MWGAISLAAKSKATFWNSFCSSVSPWAAAETHRKHRRDILYEQKQGRYDARDNFGSLKSIIASILWRKGRGCGCISIITGGPGHTTNQWEQRRWHLTTFSNEVIGWVVCVRTGDTCIEYFMFYITFCRELTGLVSRPDSLRFFQSKMSRLERRTSLQISIHLRSMHEAILRLWRFLLKTELWLPQIRAESVTTLPRVTMAAILLQYAKSATSPEWRISFCSLAETLRGRGFTEHVCCSCGIGWLYHET